ncbi:MAG: IS110 family transposase [Dehalococcoidia bacterium]|nr:MAG: IS110 family transposase [Dehalococcoidia bacterium]
MAKYHVGVDIGKQTHKACIRNLGQDSYSGVFSIDVSRQGFEKFTRTLEKHSINKVDFLVGIEATGNYGSTLVYFLISQGYKVVEINPYRADNYRKAQGKKAKTDRIDARSLAGFLSMEGHKALSIPDPIIDNLRELTRFRADLVKDRGTLLNQLHNVLTTLFPEFAGIFSKLDSATSLAILTAFPGPEYIQIAGEDKVSEVLRCSSRGRFGKDLALSLISAAQNSIGIMQRESALAVKLSILGERLISLKLAVERVEKEINELFRKLPYNPEDFPVGDVTSIATIISEVEDINRFSTIKQFLSHFGWCPKSCQTGTYNQEHPRMSHAGNKYVRRIIWMLSIVAIKNVTCYRDYFLRRVAEGKAKMDIIVAIGRKLLSVFYAILKTGIPFNPNLKVNGRYALARH